MSEENKYDISDLITSAALQQPSEFQAAFDDLVIDRLRNAVEDRKVEIAQAMYRNDSPEDIETDDYNDEFGVENSEEEEYGEES
jgi:hypothetical protein